MANRNELLADLQVQAKERFLALQSTEEIKDFLKNNGAYQRDVDRIYREVKRDVRKEYTEQVEAWVNEGQSDEQIRQQLTGQLEENLREQVIVAGRQSAVNALQREVYRLMDAGVPMEKIMVECARPWADHQTVMGWMERRIAQKEEAVAEESGSNGGRILGAVILVVGLGLTFASMSSSGSSGGYSVFYGAILYGLFKMIKG
ncbi:hypothetical protein [Lewinella sp. LCG006]|uniref:hypothetical protein n=1 Tax=Lewinella sp. LCG006 TaxID=3231911 RepID=UPI003460CECD